MRKIFFTIGLIWSSIVYPQLPGGTYIIGSGGNYANFTSAINAMSSGISGPVLFNIKDGTYTENITISAITGTSATNTITFQSLNGDSSKVILNSTSTSNPTLWLNKGSYLLFSKITIQSTGHNSVKLNGGSSNNKFNNCQLIGKNFASSSTLYNNTVVYSTGDASTPDNYNEFNGNLIKYGSHGIYLASYTNTYEYGFKFINNKFVDNAGYCLYLSYADSPEITGNIITSSVSGSSRYGMYLNYCRNTMRINYNKVYFTNIFGWGIYLHNCYPNNSDPSELFNNFVQVGGTSGNGIGLFIDYVQKIRIYHNNVLSTHTGTGSNFAAIYLQGAPPSSTLSAAHYDIQNNNFVNTGNGYAISTYDTDIFDILKNNNYYATGVNIGRWGNTNCANIATWVNASSETNTFNLDPQYISNTDLHIQNNELVGKGANLLSYVADDIDLQERPDPPTIGADEPGIDPPCNKPIASIKEGNRTICEDADAIFSLNLSGDTPFSYQWKKDGNNLSNATGSIYNITNCSLTDAGNYACVITNKCESITTSSAILTVDSLPVIYSKIENKNKCERDSVLFLIAAGGSKLSYQWTKSEENIPDATNSVFSIYDLIKIDEDIYSCKVSNSCGTVILSPFLLYINTQPSVNIAPVTQTIKTGDKVTFTVTPSGSSPFSYQWLKNDIDIDGATDSQFSILSSQLSDAGIYKCRITNSCGSNTPIIGTLIINNINGYDVSGVVEYYNTIKTPVINSLVFLKTIEGIKVDSTMTDNSGAYSFNNVLNGIYILDCKTILESGGYNPLDALIVIRNFNGTSAITDLLKLKAANVNNDKVINPVDALLINKRYIGTITKFSISDWIFENPMIEVNGENVIQAINAICAGDVNTSYPSKK